MVPLFSINLVIFTANTKIPVKIKAQYLTFKLLLVYVKFCKLSLSPLGFKPSQRHQRKRTQHHKSVNKCLTYFKFRRRRGHLIEGGWGAYLIFPGPDMIIILISSPCKQQHKPFINVKSVTFSTVQNVHLACSQIEAMHKSNTTCT